MEDEKIVNLVPYLKNQFYSIFKSYPYIYIVQVALFSIIFGIMVHDLFLIVNYNNVLCLCLSNSFLIIFNISIYFTLNLVFNMIRLMDHYNIFSDLEEIKEKLVSRIKYIYCISFIISISSLIVLVWSNLAYFNNFHGIYVPDYLGLSYSDIVIGYWYIIVITIILFVFISIIMRQRTLFFLKRRHKK